ncbi:MAG: hypothetical protein NZM43_04655 [Saprospiraceae bacterium]|nr:hypothetical protein [Saprospiraceae bacterium]MDW8483599.1 hypothetical protein [Saprospiraceae bacterium]
MPQVTFQYPAWFLVLCALLGLGYALLLYYRETTFREQAPHLHRFLGVLRWFVVSVVAALLLSPLLRRVQTQTQKPVVVLAQDQSESVGAELKGAALERYKADWRRLREALSEDYDVHEFAFGDAVREGVNFEFTDKVSNLSRLIQEVYDRFGTQNLGALVMATDGIYNQGSSPLYAGAPIVAPVFTVALGDTTLRKDLLLKRVLYNRIVYLGDRFTIQVDAAAVNCAGAQAVLTVSRIEGEQVRTLQSIPISIDQNDFFTTKEVVIEADKTGVQQFRFTLSKIPGERSTVNNTRDIFVDVLDARQKILLLANSPHPDISAIRQTLEGNRNYEVTVAYAGESGTDVSKFDFVVLHNLPSNSQDIGGILGILDSKRIPRLFIAGMQTNFSSLSRVQRLVNAQSTGQQTDDVQAKVSPQFAAFTLSPELASELPKFTPLTSAFGNFSALPQAQVVLYKRIGRVDTEQPLLVVGETDGIRCGVLLGEGLWKWRLFDYMQHNNHQIFNEIIGKTILYLSQREDKRKFRVSLDQSIFNENEPIFFNAELYNDNYELINTPDVALSIRNAEGKEFLYTFNKIGNAYRLNAGILPVGNYTFRATTSLNNQTLTYEGRFSVQPIQLEDFATTANHSILRQLSAQHGGEMVYPRDLLSIADKIKQMSNIKPVIYQSTQTTPLIHLKWVFFLLVLLLSLEWFLRRYFGAY